ncbi:RagB/SusD family nutrient uptake outer membrane protein [Zobellia nedashkovskayae]|uniref:RagB/SusD family nutrient uptake outer membrane protein n=1 Tax=Zobellia nedashkovskayae TaxID=2779510 RepID=UPI00188DC110|nr:RagB/SusD family nutrient uptake outer membrane protein [Zobellia nedashkovskayae]
MKKINFYIFLVAIFGFYSCADELDLAPLDRVTPDTFYKTRADFDGAIFSSYSSLQDFYGTSTETLGETGEYWKISMIITDDAEVDANSGDTRTRSADNLQVTSADVAFQAVFGEIYEGIYRANIVLENLEGENELTAEDKTVLSAEAKFLRAFYHFQALKLFGETSPIAIAVGKDLNDLALPNAGPGELYAQILTDFSDAAAGLPEAWDGGNTGRATAWAAKSFIGKVNVFKEDWPAAITAIGDVVENGPYSLVTSSYDDVFAYNNENNSESIFEIQYGGPFSDDNIWVFDDNHSENFKGSQGSGRAWYWDPANGAPAQAQGWFIPTQDLVDAFEPGDTRLETSIYQPGETYYKLSPGGVLNVLDYDPTWSSNGLSLKKYRGQTNMVAANYSPNGVGDFNNERWFRFAELKLLYAEALIRGGGDVSIAVQQIQDIRDRAGLTAPMNSDPLAAMMQEKRVEMAFEPHRWFDIVRWDLGPTIFGSSWDPKLEVFPFPLSEIDRSGGLMTQNAGY